MLPEHGPDRPTRRTYSKGGVGDICRRSKSLHEGLEVVGIELQLCIRKAILQTSTPPRARTETYQVLGQGIEHAVNILLEQVVYLSRHSVQYGRTRSFAAKKVPRQNVSSELCIFRSFADKSKVLSASGLQYCRS